MSNLLAIKKKNCISGFFVFLFENLLKNLQFVELQLTSSFQLTLYKFGSWIN